VSEAARRISGPAPRHLTSPLLARAGLPHLFTTRHFPGLDAPVGRAVPFGPEGRRILAQHGLDGGEPAFAAQVHGRAVLPARTGGRAGVGDALLTDRPGLPLAVFTADCLPLVLYDPSGGRLALVHAGWRGTVEAVARAAVEALLAAGGRPEALLAAGGPSIGPCCYEVDLPVIEPLAAAYPTRWEAWVTPRGRGKWMLDLRAANRDQLEAAGLERGRVDIPALCTACREDLFFSYRRGHRGGRLAAVAALPAVPPTGGAGPC
jgi:YfiH family protein